MRSQGRRKWGEEGLRCGGLGTRWGGSVMRDARLGGGNTGESHLEGGGGLGLESRVGVIHLPPCGLEVGRRRVYNIARGQRRALGGEGGVCGECTAWGPIAVHWGSHHH